MISALSHWLILVLIVSLIYWVVSMVAPPQIMRVVHGGLRCDCCFGLDLSSSPSGRNSYGRTSLSRWAQVR